MGSGALPPHHKVITRERLLSLRERARSEGVRVVHCHGCFDLVHPGHVRHLRQARSLGDVLLVSVSADAHVRKGAHRPLIPHELRAENLAALDCVDWVYVEHRATAAELLDEVRPDVYVKGQEYERNADPRFLAERDAVERHGGRVVFTSGDIVFSSTALIQSLADTDANPHQRAWSALFAHDELAPLEVEGVLDRMRTSRVLIVGEAWVASEARCDHPSMDDDCPAMVVRPVEERSAPGGAASLALHAAAAGAEVTLVTALGDDAPGGLIRERLEGAGVRVESARATTPTPERRTIRAGARTLLREDRTRGVVLDARQLDALAESCGRCAVGADAALVIDAGMGLMTHGLVERLRAPARDGARLLVGASLVGRGPVLRLRRPDLIVMREAHLRAATGIEQDGLPVAAWRAVSQTRGRACWVGLGEEGSVMFTERVGLAEDDADEFRSRLIGTHIPPIGARAEAGARGVGALFATLALGADSTPLVAAAIGSAAAIVGSHRGEGVPVTLGELRRVIEGARGAHVAISHQPLGLAS